MTGVMNEPDRLTLERDGDALARFKTSQLVARSGITSRRNLYWYYKQIDGLNFGDWIGPYLFEKMTGRLPCYFNPRVRTLGTYFSGCGSILGHIRHSGKAIVWGSGAIKPEIKFAAPRQLRAVRGPLSRQICLDQGYECPPIYGDPGVLLPIYYKPRPSPRRYSLGIVPHFTDTEVATRLFGGVTEVRIVDVRRSVEAVVDDIVDCEAIVSSSLHGIIVAQAYGLPVARLVMLDRVIGGSFKFEDYYRGAGLAVPPRTLTIDAKHPPSIEELRSAAMAADQLDVVHVANRLLDVSPF